MDFTSLSSLWTKSSENHLSGYVKTAEEVLELVAAFERITSSRFSTLKGPRGSFGNAELGDISRIHLKDVKSCPIVEEDGTPFCLKGTFKILCQYGPDNNRARKRKADNVSDALADHPNQPNTKRVHQNSVKKGCPAAILVKEVFSFPAHKVDDNLDDVTDYQLRKIAKVIKADKNLVAEKRFYIKLPNAIDHIGHTTEPDMGFQNHLDRDVKEQIRKWVRLGFTSTHHVHKLVTCYSNSLNPPPNPNNRAYFPTLEDVRNHIKLVLGENKKSTMDLENLVSFANELKEKGHKVFLRNNEPGKLVFVHANPFQEIICERYGNDIALLDATYKTTKYSLPLFFVSVRTNCGYKVVASFVIEQETTAAISEALQYVYQFLPFLRPKFWIVDYSEPELASIETVFKDTERVFLCDFHRRQAWDRWIRAKKNGVAEDAEEITALLQGIALSDTLAEMEKAINALRASAVYRAHKRFKQYIETRWLSCKERWVWAYKREQTVIVNTTNGVERQYRTFKEGFLHGVSDKTLTGMLTSLIQTFLVAEEKSYIRDNALALNDIGRTYNSSVPEFLHNRPKWFVKHAMDTMEISRDVVAINKMSEGTFLVTTERQETVRLDSGGRPDCSCDAFKRTHNPCEHIMALILQRFCKWDDFPQTYCNHPWFSVDRDILKFQRSPPRSPQATATRITPPSPSFMSTSILQRLCREKLAVLTDMTYLLEDDSELELLYNMLSESSSTARSLLYTEEMLPVIPSSSRSPLSKEKQENDNIRPSVIIGSERTVQSRFGTRIEIIHKENLPPKSPKQTQQTLNSVQIADAQVSPIPTSDISQTPNLPNPKKKPRLILQKPAIEVVDLEQDSEPEDSISLSPVLQTKMSSVPKVVDIGPEAESEDCINLSSDEEEEVGVFHSTLKDRLSPRFPIVSSLVATQASDKHNSTDDMDIGSGAILSCDKRDLDELKAPGTPISNSVIDRFAELQVQNNPTSQRIHYISVEHVLHLRDKPSKLRNTDVSKQDLILAPLFEAERNHWTLLVMRPKKKEISYLNPMGETEADIAINKEFMMKLMAENGVIGVTYRGYNHPKQVSNMDCGIHVMQFIENLVMDVEIPPPRNLDQLRLHYHNYIQTEGTYPSVDLRKTASQRSSRSLNESRSVCEAPTQEQLARQRLNRENMLTHPVGHVASVTPNGTVVYDRDLSMFVRHSNGSVKKTVMDAYMELLVLTLHREKNKRISYIPIDIMASLLTKPAKYADGNLQCFSIVVSFVWNKKTRQWTLLAMFPNERKFNFVHPKGECNEYLGEITDFVKRFSAANKMKAMKYKQRQHPYITNSDGSIDILKFAERMCKSRALKAATKEDRKEMALFIRDNTVDKDDLCALCGDEEDHAICTPIAWIDCDRCGVWFHDHCISATSSGNREARNMFHCENCISQPAPPVTKSNTTADFNQNLFELVQLKSSIKVCRGNCKTPFAFPSVPPHDLVARRHERYVYYKNGTRNYGEGWRYYHLSANCLPIAHRNVGFRALDQAILDALTPLHKLHLREIGASIPNL